MIKIKDKYLLNKNLDKVKDKRVLVRVDLNTSEDENYRIKIAKDLCKYLKTAKQIIYISHLGQPSAADLRGLRRGFTRIKNKYSLKKFIRSLPKFKFVSWKPGEKLPDYKYLLLENLRFFEGEEKNGLEFAKSLANLADIYVNEAFSASHRMHASIVGIPKFLPSYFGVNFEQEIENLNKVFQQKKGLAIVIAGAKIATKIPLIKKFIKKADLIIVGGLTAKEFMKKQFIKSSKILIPINPVTNDTDQESIGLFLKKLKPMKLIVWNGPLGKFEDKNFEKGTLMFAQGLAKIGEMNLKDSFRSEIKTGSAFHKNFTIVGGGDTISFLYKHNLQNKYDFISTGGGAMLDYLAKETLPGIEAIQNS